MSAGMEVSTSWGFMELFGGDISFSTEMKWEITKTNSEMTGEEETVRPSLPRFWKPCNPCLSTNRFSLGRTNSLVGAQGQPRRSNPLYCVGF